MDSPPQPAYTDTISAEMRTVLEPMRAAKPLNRMPPLVMRMFSWYMQNAVVKRRGVTNVRYVKSRMAGVPVRIFTRPGVEAATVSRMLINVHGGGFEADAGSKGENIPLAVRMDAVVVGVLYRKAPEHQFPAAVDDLLAVYREALKTRTPDRIVVYGTSAGAVLTMQFLARLKAEGLPMPAAAGVFSGAGDTTITGDCEAYLPPIMAGERAAETLNGYLGDADRTDPLVSPTRGDLSGLPPVLLLTSTRDQLLSSTVILHRALKRAGVWAELEVWDGLPHAFWGWLDGPETEEAFDAMATFFDKHMG